MQASGRGRIHSLSVLVQALDPEAGESPTVLALIELEEGPVMMSNIVGDGAADARIGDAVIVDFQRQSESITLPVFRRA